MTTPDLVSVTAFRQHMQLPDTTVDNSRLQVFIDAATQLVCEYIADRNPADEDWIAEIEAWDCDSVPRVVLLAVLMQAAEAYRFIGDDEKTPQERGYLAPGIENLLSRYKNRAFA